MGHTTRLKDAHTVTPSIGTTKATTNPSRLEEKKRVISPGEPQTSILQAVPPPHSFAYSVAPGNCGGAAGRRRRGREEEPPGPRSPRAPGLGRRERRCSGDTPRPLGHPLGLAHLRSRFPFMELGGVLRTRRAPTTGGKEAAQGATRRDRHPHSAPRRGGDGFSSATALRKLSSGRAAVGRQHATMREEGEA